ncbi:hypothetical protein F5B18DRAFT_284101 [Nemania serpens]|nr:hypothetical protein F5B18DRAFT_284101 [Nemania serpens]
MPPHPLQQTLFALPIACPYNTACPVFFFLLSSPLFYLSGPASTSERVLYRIVSYGVVCVMSCRVMLCYAMPCCAVLRALLISTLPASTLHTSC